MENTRYYLELLVGMTEKELKGRYKNTLFGFLWIFINPVLQMLVIGFVFRLFIKEPIDNYFMYLLAGLLVWNFFSLSLTKATTSIVNERNLIKKARFPRSVIPLSIIIANFINLLLGLTILLVPAIIFNTLSGMWLVQVFSGLFLLVSFTVGICLLTASLNVRFRDINFLVQAFLILWFYITPIVYSIFVVPRELIWVWRLNPLTVVLQLFQSAFAQAPSAGIFMMVANITIIFVTFTIGILIFEKESKNFDDWL